MRNLASPHGRRDGATRHRSGAAAPSGRADILTNSDGVEGEGVEVQARDAGRLAAVCGLGRAESGDAAQQEGQSALHRRVVGGAAGERVGGLLFAPHGSVQERELLLVEAKRVHAAEELRRQLLHEGRGRHRRQLHVDHGLRRVLEGAGHVLQLRLALRGGEGLEEVQAAENDSLGGTSGEPLCEGGKRVHLCVGHIIVHDKAVRPRRSGASKRCSFRVLQDEVILVRAVLT
mmetsp:Transcript_23954/g.76906  ORF Transcript_23954/g.76906 Transcript_23954/m.76906 type:complete len:232 (+) Transcript_23954:480-1175(+)